MPRYVSDEVWQRLDPAAGRLSRRAVLRGWIAVVTALALVLAGTVVWRAGLVVPRLLWSNAEQHWVQTDDGFRMDVLLLNTGWWPVTVVGVGRSAPGLELLGVEGDCRPEGTGDRCVPLSLAPHTGVGMTLVYRISDCATAPMGDWPVTAAVRRPWGDVTVTVAEEFGISSWQSAAVDGWCREHR
jgi:hypothetical protein